MASAYKTAAAAPRERKPEEGRGARHRRIRSEWLRCAPDTPWGVHGRIEEDRCSRCGWAR